jgi:GTP-binding protein EngB required for normal cell division
MRMKRSRTVLCLGKSQVGKSRTCNLLCGRDGLFEEGNKISSCTMQPARETVQFEQGDTTIELTVIDMPGLFDTRSAQDNDKLMERIRDFIKYEMHSLDRVFYVVKLGAITPEEVKCLELVRAMFSDAVVSSGLFSVLLTHCDSMSEAERANLVKEVGVSSGLKPHLPLFDNGSGPQILAVDFSKNSKSVEADVRKVLTSILCKRTEACIKRGPSGSTQRCKRLRSCRRCVLLWCRTLNRSSKPLTLRARQFAQSNEGASQAELVHSRLRLCRASEGVMFLCFAGEDYLLVRSSQSHEEA